MKKKLISIIVPVYNVEKYLEECVRSIQKQTYKELEIILVNDGSTDDSGKLCEAFATEDARIRVIHKENGGSTSARKAGLILSEGEYIGFVDSDDWIETEMYSELIKIAEREEADITVSAIISETEDTSYKTINAIQEGTYKGERLETEVYSKMLFDQEKQQLGLLPSLYTKLYRRKVIYDNMLSLEERIFYGEDMVCLMLSCLSAECISITKEAWYHYRVRSESISTTKNDKIFENNRIFYNVLYDNFINTDYANILTKQLKRYSIILNSYAMKKLYDIDCVQTLWIFPYELVKKNSKIIIYGAGSVGRSYWSQLGNRNIYNVVAWMDSNAYNLNIGHKIVNPETITEYEYDYVIIAVSKQDKAEEIRDSLLNMGIPKKKIIWKKSYAVPTLYTWNFNDTV